MPAIPRRRYSFPAQRWVSVEMLSPRHLNTTRPPVLPLAGLSNYWPTPPPRSPTFYSLIRPAPTVPRALFIGGLAYPQERHQEPIAAPPSLPPYFILKIGELSTSSMHRR